MTEIGLRRFPWSSFVFLCRVPLLTGLALLLASTASWAQNVATDKFNYQPGDRVTITGEGWQPQEAISIVIGDTSAINPDVQIDLTADSDGRFSDDTFVVPESDRDLMLTLTAQGATGRETIIAFKDGVAPGALNCPSLSPFNPTHYSLPVGQTVTCTIEGATDLSAAQQNGTAPTEVLVKSSVLGNETATVLAVNGTTITFRWTAPANACATTIVSYGPIVVCNPKSNHCTTFPSDGNDANNFFLGTGHSVAGFANVDSQGNVISCSPVADCAVIDAVRGVPITPVTLAASGGAGGPYTFVATGLPAGLSMSTDGTISGTPTVTGTFSYTVTITDRNGNQGTISCSLTVNPPPVAVTAGCVTIEAMEGQAITPVTLAASGGVGGPYTFVATGLPAGLSMSTDGTISGTPTVTGTFSYTVTITDRNGNQGTISCSLTVNPPPVAVTAGCVTIEAMEGQAITPVTLTASGGVGGPYTFMATGLPAGLSMSTDGTISGTPTVTGTFSYTVTITDRNGNQGTVSCSLTVNPPPVTAGCATVDAVEGRAITPVTLAASGGVGGPYTFMATGLPAGLSMSTDGTISGTPTVTGTFSYTVTITDRNGNQGTISCSLTVNPPPVTAGCATVDAVEGQAIAPVTLTASGGVGGPYTFVATGLPAGLSMSTNGTISGTPTVTGTFSYTVTITDRNGNQGTTSCSLTVNQPPPVTAGCVTIEAVEGQAIAPVTLSASGGVGGPYTFVATGLPPGLSMSSGGTISGTPTVSGTFSYTVTVGDKDGNSGTADCSVTVSMAPPVCTISGVTISNTSWNSFPIPAGTHPVVWVNLHIGKPTGIPTSSPSEVRFTRVSLSVNGTQYALPDGLLTFDPAAPATITTTFNAAQNRWEELINPKNLSDEIFFTGAAIPVTPTMASSAKATLTFTVMSWTPQLSFSWQWSAAVYTFWPADWNQALIRPYHSSYHAGTPLNLQVQRSLIQGPRGGGGSNYTGSWSATGNGTCPTQ